ncbi:sulfate/molybdate ABC transporter ATP-binding protein [Leucobacter triazinivorans]|uniref:sulfate/molybdate ABC transporter ATP-binding protein n=1 Tax=Leucobacter triazinivorans TaxID=1784719 RepID=UPI0013EE4270|nr:ATP-binding cassette domain-containing protein [Leucobacter triazinivorans]
MSGRLSFEARVQRGAFALHATGHVDRGEVLGVIGANGSGKSTLIGAIAGTHRITAGRIALGDRVLCSRAAGAPEIQMPRSERRIGHLDQRARLFPHLDVRANIAFGPRAQGARRRAADVVAEEWLERIGLPDRARSHAHQLSGGQQQRVAIARALAARPDAVLLDEPFAALDVVSSEELRALVAAELSRSGVPMVIVTHDPVDLIALADRVLVLEQGRIGQSGRVADVLAAPSSPFAAEFTGRVLVKGVASERGTLRLADAPLDELHGRGELPAPGEPAVASFAPSSVRVRPADTAHPRRLERTPQGRTCWNDTIRSVSASAAGAAGVRLEFAGWPGFAAELPLSGALERWLATGSPVRLELSADDVRYAVPRRASEPGEVPAP